MGKKTEFLFLSEQDCIDAGILDVAASIDNSEEVFKLLAKGDYLMGGAQHDNHGMYIMFPESSPFPNMPLAGPDRRFAAMPAYVGGRFDMCGVKWYGSNAENKKIGLPRSVLTVTLNDKSTGEPLCFMSANIMSSKRTGAIPAIGARYLAKKDAEVLTCIGCGPIGEACMDAIVTEMKPKGLKKVIAYDISIEAAERFAKMITERYGIEAVGEADQGTACLQADIISVAVSRVAPLHFKREWIKPGTLLIASGPLQCEEELWLDMEIVLDHLGLHHEYVKDSINSGDKDKGYATYIGGPIYHLIDAGKKPPIDDMKAMGKIILGEQEGRTSDDEIICFINCGMAVFDIALSHDIYKNALEKGIGQKLTLWDDPYQVK